MKCWGKQNLVHQELEMKAPFLVSLACALVLPLVALQSDAADREGPRISGPFTAQNLSIYFVHGPSRPGPVPLTLAEALKGNEAVVYETGQVSRLAIENKGDREVFVQAGDIVKGGRQDRVIAVSLLLPPRSGRVPIGAFCVEQGRWRKRGIESAAKFHSAKEMLPLKAAKLALVLPDDNRRTLPPSHARPNVRVPATVQQRLAGRQGIVQTRTGASKQQRVWASVGAMQSKLSRNLKTTVKSDVSRSSLQLTLEHKKLTQAREKLIAALKDKADGENNVVGYVFAINGNINSGDVYPSHGLFVKMWPRLLAAAATEAIAEKTGKPNAKPSPVPADKVMKFMAAAERGNADRQKLDKRLERERRVAKGKAVLTTTRRLDGGFVHRSYVAY
jgi:ARG and Rhodanese-Phosphatase-superfamily-associated Protein domain